MNSVLASQIALALAAAPDFPMGLAATDGANDLRVAQLAVAAFAVASPFLLARHAALRLGSDWAGFWRC